jgi:Cu/Ag efflux protein CusF
MRRAFLTAAIGLLFCVASLSAFEATGTIKKVDADKGTVYIHAGGQDRTVKLDPDAKFLDKDGKPLADGLKAKELKEGAEVTITVERGDGGPIIKAIRLGKQTSGSAEPKGEGKASVGLKPLTEMTASDKYKGEDGGLYGGGKNEPPEAHLAAARKETSKIEPLEADGKPAKDGTIGLVSISMSNATMEFSLFKQLADKDPEKLSRVTIVDCAQGGQAMAEWVDPKGRAWTEADRRLSSAKVSPNQVQVVWVKLANKGPRGDLSEHGKKLQKDTLAVLHNAKERFPNLRIAYLGSRIYAGWANTQLNPEPYAYESAFVVRWLIQDQTKGDAELNYDPARGAVKAPLLLWGPYFWGDGTTPRKSDGLVWERKDLAGDGTHPSQSGRQKVADMLLGFFKSDPLAASWFVTK